jgi:hypothetical protein
MASTKVEEPAKTVAPAKKPVLEDEDSFEDFPADDWELEAGKEKAHQWQDSWEDEAKEVDFAVLLKYAILLILSVEKKRERVLEWHRCDLR